MLELNLGERRNLCKLNGTLSVEYVDVVVEQPNKPVDDSGEPLLFGSAATCRDKCIVDQGAGLKDFGR